MTLFRVLASGIAHCTESGCTDGGFIGEVLSWFILGVPIALFFGLIWLLGDPPWAKWNRDARRDKRLERMAKDVVAAEPEPEPDPEKKEIARPRSASHWRAGDEL